MNRLTEFIVDCVWPVAHGSMAGTAPAPNVPDTADLQVLKSMSDAVQAELKREDDRRTSVDGRLQAVGSVVPVAVTLLLAVVTFLTSGRSGDFRPISIKVLAFISSYAALQFLRAMIASVTGLGRRKYRALRPADIVTNVASEREYIRGRVIALIGWIDLHREQNNEKVTNLALAHRAMLNGAAALVCGVLVLLGIVVLEF